MNRILTLLLVVLLSAAGAEDKPMQIQDDTLERSREYVRGLDLDCTLTDGYTCARIDEDQFLSPDSWGRMIPARYLLAWQVCREDFDSLTELSAEQKDLRHYKVGFTENETQYVVIFQGLLLPVVSDSGEPTGASSAVFGRSVKYWVDKASLQIDKRLYL